MTAPPPDQLRNLLALVIEKHGVRAPAVAQHNALKARHEGDAARAAAWDAVARLAEQALRRDPDA